MWIEIDADSWARMMNTSHFEPVSSGPMLTGGTYTEYGRSKNHPPGLRVEITDMGQRERYFKWRDS